jgi:DNA-binding transcriptional LysR family regulator
MLLTQHLTTTIGCLMKNHSEIINGVASVMRVAKEGSFRGAMRSGGIGFRTLQHHVKTVEDQLGFLIFHRTPDGVVPTSEGRAVIEYAQQIDEIVSKIVRLGNAQNRQTEGEVMLAATEGLGTFWISPRLSQFSEVHQNISIRLHPSMAITDMRRFEIDLAIQVVEPLLPEIKRVKVGTMHLMLAASHAYIAQHGKPETVQDLAKHKFVFHTNPQSSDRLLIEKMIGQKLEQSQFIVMRNSSAHYMTIEHGDGIGFIPTYGFAIGAKTVPLDVPVHYSLDIWVCFHSDSRSIPRVSNVIDWLGTIFDPRMYPWFRRDFVNPREFDRILEQNGGMEMVKKFGFDR